jgi:hypothetical protein
MKPFATLGSEIGKVRERVRRGAESLRPSRVAIDVKEQRDRLLAKLGEQTFRLIAERKLAVPKVLQEPVERLASLLGVQLPPWPTGDGHDPHHPATASADDLLEPVAATQGEGGGFVAVVEESVAEAASAPIAPEPVAFEPPTLEPARAHVRETSKSTVKTKANSSKSKASREKSSPSGAKRGKGRRTK